MNKLDFIDSYIKLCDEVISSSNTSEAKKLQDVIIGIFGSEITDIKDMLDNYRGYYSSPRQIDFIGDIKLIKQKLLNYKFNLQDKQKKVEYKLELARLKQPQIFAHAEANPTQSTTASFNIAITVEQTIKCLKEIPENCLSSSDKNTLQDFLFSLEGIKAAKDKSKFWDITKGVLKFLADKGADAAIATLPFIITGLQSFK